VAHQRRLPDGSRVQNHAATRWFILVGQIVWLSENKGSVPAGYIDMRRYRATRRIPDCGINMWVRRTYRAGGRVQRFLSISKILRLHFAIVKFLRRVTLGI
jgi:hypothetical protein